MYANGADSRGNPAGDAQPDAQGDPDLAELVSTWVELAPGQRAAVLSVVRALGSGKRAEQQQQG